MRDIVRKISEGAEGAREKLEKIKLAASRLFRSYARTRADKEREEKKSALARGEREERLIKETMLAHDITSSPTLFRIA